MSGACSASSLCLSSSSSHHCTNILLSATGTGFWLKNTRSLADYSCFGTGRFRKGPKEVSSGQDGCQVVRKRKSRLLGGYRRGLQSCASFDVGEGKSGADADRGPAQHSQASPAQGWCASPAQRLRALPAQHLLALVLAAQLVVSPPPAQDDTFENVPQALSGSEKRRRIQRPKSREAENCTKKCVTTCVRGGEGAPGEGPLNIRRPLVVFKEGFRSRQYCLLECSEICNLIPDGEDGP